LVYISCCLAGRAYPFGNIPKVSLGYVPHANILFLGVRVAILGDFSPKNANLEIFWPFGNLGIFRGILKFSYNRAFSVKYSKNMRISAFQNMFRPIFQVI
jgi:hypothetical protein